MFGNRERNAKRDKRKQRYHILEGRNIEHKKDKRKQRYYVFGNEKETPKEIREVSGIMFEKTETQNIIKDKRKQRHYVWKNRNAEHKEDKRN